MLGMCIICVEEVKKLMEFKFVDVLCVVVVEMSMIEMYE